MTLHTVSVDFGDFTHNGEHSQTVEAYAGEVIKLNAIVPDGYNFVRWEASQDIFGDSLSANTTVTMPDTDMEIHAVLRTDPVFIAEIDSAISDDIVSVTAKIHCETNGCTALCVFYNYSGQMLDIDMMNTSERDDSLIFTTKNANCSIAKIIVRDSHCIPQCVCKTVDVTINQ